jgi:hypothetical protein
MVTNFIGKKTRIGGIAGYNILNLMHLTSIDGIYSYRSQIRA